jgi:predicted alpha/beta superfamily hydrolase
MKSLLLGVFLAGVFLLANTIRLGKSTEDPADATRFTTYTFACGHFAYEMRVMLPPNYAGSTTRMYPAIHLLDAENHWDLVANSLFDLQTSGQVEPSILVGLSSLQKDPQSLQFQRLRNFTPPASLQYILQLRKQDAFFRDKAFGGADILAKELVEVWMPSLRQYFRIDPSDQTLIGVSVSGLFALYSWQAYPGVFRNLILASPSLWWDRNQLLESIDLQETNGHQGSRIFLGVGEFEQPPETAFFAMVDNTLKLEAKLSDGFASNVQCQLQIMAGADHADTPAPLIQEGLVWLHGVEKAETASQE